MELFEELSQYLYGVSWRVYKLTNSQAYLPLCLINICIYYFTTLRLKNIIHYDNNKINNQEFRLVASA